MTAHFDSVKLPIQKVDKVWGRDVLPAPFQSPEGRRIGEIWFEPPERLSQLLVKYIFTSDKLSVQVHPTDQQARASGAEDRGGGGGKEECWLVIDAEPGAVLGIGFREPVSAEAMRAAALDGSIEDLLAWHPVEAGDFFYIPANVVHAIGAGISLIEVQQNADITYRLYDYGRPRELHLDAGIAVAKGEVFDQSLKQRVPNGGTLKLADGPYFTLHRVCGSPDADTAELYNEPTLVIPLRGEINAGGTTLLPGEAGLVESAQVVSAPADAQFLLAKPKKLAA